MPMDSIGMKMLLAETKSAITAPLWGSTPFADCAMAEIVADAANKEGAKVRRNEASALLMMVSSGLTPSRSAHLSLGQKRVVVLASKLAKQWRPLGRSVRYIWSYHELVISS